MLDFAPRVRAVLGPTNTGKTHLAIERLLAHRSGIIGFPLRLLARENYERMVAAKGARFVALITGEEKIVPPEARWFSCTVEAMPLGREVEFLAVDEIQLAADPDRGHVFTDRLLHARGLVETMFLGAETIRPLLARLVPEAVIETRPRLSRLFHTGPMKLSRLPPRTAVVAFSAEEVYAIAEAIRRRRGGCAVVMGRLSPRTRNAQVALYQAKEVDFLVATDAIGMGLNMDVDHVAFASLNKFDGHQRRSLSAAELAQIAGRAGRGMRDGSFGTTAECPPLDDDVVRALEEHSFEPLRQVCWRNSALDFQSIDALLASLAKPSGHAALARGNDASDFLTLAALADVPEIRQKARSPTRVRLLWEACQIPDFRKIADDSHTRLCARVFMHLAEAGRLPEAWLAEHIQALARTDGEIEALMDRLAAIRVWSYIAARSEWVRNAEAWQERARTTEELLSDALHERLLARFVDRRATHLLRRLAEAEQKPLLAGVARNGNVVVEGHTVGRVLGFSFEPDSDAAVGSGPEGWDERRMVLRAARRALAVEIPRRVAALEAAEDAAFALSPKATLLWDGAVIGRLVHGPTVLRPLVEVAGSDLLDGRQREAIRSRLQGFVDRHIAATLAPLFAAAKAAEDTPALRGVVHRLCESLGVLPRPNPGLLTPALRRELQKLGVKTGRHAWFFPLLLKPRALSLRAVLWAVQHDCPVPRLPPSSRISIPPPADWPDGFALAMGWVAAGPVLLRLDIAERISKELAEAARRGEQANSADLAMRLAVKAHHLADVVAGLKQTAARERSERRALRRRANARAKPSPSGPFAVLAALRRG
ncbi:MAG: DNA helicase [Acidobacteriia bacterium]|nr:DNA helicase [Methyloceanibacter sp.]MCL6490256.1 DNA helicase [Terriglobia bacterium]